MIIGNRVKLIDVDNKEYNCYVAGYDKSIGITLKGIDSNKMLCLDMKYASAEEFDTMSNEIKQGSFNVQNFIQKFSLPPVRKSTEPCPFVA